MNIGLPKIPTSFLHFTHSCVLCLNDTSFLHAAAFKALVGYINQVVVPKDKEYFPVKVKRVTGVGWLFHHYKADLCF